MKHWGKGGREGNLIDFALLGIESVRELSMKPSCMRKHVLILYELYLLHHGLRHVLGVELQREGALRL